MRLRPGDRVDRYEVLGPLGEGGVAEVFRVRHVLLQQERAMKVMTLISPRCRPG